MFLDTVSVWHYRIKIIINGEPDKDVSSHHKPSKFNGNPFQLEEFIKPGTWSINYIVGVLAQIHN